MVAALEHNRLEQALQVSLMPEQRVQLMNAAEAWDNE